MATSGFAFGFEAPSDAAIPTAPVVATTRPAVEHAPSEEAAYAAHWPTEHVRVGEGILLPAAIKQLNEEGFYQELLQLGQQPLLRSKLLLVGPGRAGKTSLLRRLTRQAFIEGQTSTSGIDVDVHLWQQSSGSGEQMEAGSEFTNAAVRAAVV